VLHLLRRLRKPDRNIRYRARLHTFGELVRITRLVGGILGIITAKEFRELARKNKYGAKRTIVDGQSFPSQGEANWYLIQRWREKIGDISEFQRHGTVRLGEAKISYKPDGNFMKQGKRAWGEYKGVETDRFRIIRKLWLAVGPGHLEIWKHNPPRLVETLIPQGIV
jgi:hypothetical protein